MKGEKVRKENVSTKKEWSIILYCVEKLIKIIFSIQKIQGQQVET